MEVVVCGPTVDEKAEGAEEAADEHGRDAPFWKAFVSAVVGFEAGVKLRKC